jgi:predicted Zn-dependent protease
LWQAGEFAAAEKICREGLAISPGNPWLTVLLTASQLDRGNFQSAVVALEPLNRSTQAPELRAAIANNLAFALLLYQRAFGSAESKARADELSNTAYSMYPCVLSYRSTRALLLTATGRPHEALALLDYANFDLSEPTDRADREGACAFAFLHLKRESEAQRAVAKCLELFEGRKVILDSLGLMSLLPSNSGMNGNDSRVSTIGIASI